MEEKSEKERGSFGMDAVPSPFRRGPAIPPHAGKYQDRVSLVATTLERLGALARPYCQAGWLHLGSPVLSTVGGRERWGQWMVKPKAEKYAEMVAMGRFGG